MDPSLLPTGFRWRSSPANHDEQSAVGKELKTAAEKSSFLAFAEKKTQSAFSLTTR